MVSEFTRQFQNQLRYSLNQHVREYVAYPAEKWLTINSSKIVPVDIYLESFKKDAIIEIESHRQDPSNNIAKLLFWYETSRFTKRLSIIQLFSPFYDKHPIKRKVSEYLGKLLSDRHDATLTYHSFDYQPKLSYGRFDTIYRNPSRNIDELNAMVEATANEIIMLIQ